MEWNEIFIFLYCADQIVLLVRVLGSDVHKPLFVFPDVLSKVSN